MTDHKTTNRPLRLLYLHQRDAGMTSRYRGWTDWLSEGRTRIVESELIAMGKEPHSALLRDALSGCWDVLIYEPPGWEGPASPEAL